MGTRWRVGLEPCYVLSRAEGGEWEHNEREQRMGMSWAVPCREPCCVVSRAMSWAVSWVAYGNITNENMVIGNTVYGNMVNGNIIWLTTLIKLVCKISGFCWLILYVVIWLWKLCIHWGKGSFTLFYWVSPLTVLRYHGIWRQVQATIRSIQKRIL